MEWIFLTAALILFVYHRTFRRCLIGLAIVAALGIGVLLYQTRPQPTVQPAASRGQSLYHELFGTTGQPTERGQHRSDELFGPAPHRPGRSFYQDMVDSGAVRQP